MKISRGDAETRRAQRKKRRLIYLLSEIFSLFPGNRGKLSKISWIIIMISYKKNNFLSAIFAPLRLCESFF